MQNNLNNQRLVHNRRVALARTHGVGLNVALLDLVSGLSVDTKPPILTIACGDNLPPGVQIQAFCSLGGKVFLAERLSKIWEATSTGVNPEAIVAHMMGELTGHCSTASVSTLEDVEQARAEILAQIKSYPPPVPMVNTALSAVWRYCRAAQTQAAVPLAESSLYLREADARTPMSVQKFRFYNHFGPAFPADAIESPDLRVHWRDLADLRIREIVMGEVAPTVSANDFVTHWISWTDESRLAFYDMMGRTRDTEMREIFSASVVVYIMSLCKDMNLTERWVTRRLNMIGKVLRDVNLTAVIGPAVIAEYSKYYPRSQLQIEKVYKRLAVAWSLLTSQGVSPLAWVIEQASMANVTTMLCFATFVNKLSYFDAHLVIRQGVPRSQFTALVELAIKLIYDPYSSLDAPPVPMSRYADLAFIGLYGCKELMKDEHLAQYVGAPSARCVKSVVQLRAIANSMMSLSNEASQSDVSIANLFMKLKDNGTNQIYVDNDRVFLYEPVAANVQVEALAADDDAAKAEARTRLNAVRKAWPAQARGMPLGTKEVSYDAMIELVLAQTLPDSVALKMILGRVIDRANQEPLALIPDQSSAVQPVKQAITDDLVNAARKWGYTVPNELKTPIPRVPDNNDIGDGVLASSYTLYYRPNANQPNQRAGAAPNEPQPGPAPGPNDAEIQV